jgi:hypothetical protein
MVKVSICLLRGPPVDPPTTFSSLFANHHPLPRRPPPDAKMHLHFLSLLLLATSALATFHQESHWAINTYNTAPKEERDDCSARGAFYVKGANGKQCCSSEKTRVPPRSGTHCPKEWAQHKRTGICVPPVRPSSHLVGISVLMDRSVDRNQVIRATAEKGTAGTETLGNARRIPRRSVKAGRGELCLFLSCGRVAHPGSTGGTNDPGHVCLTNLIRPGNVPLVKLVRAVRRYSPFRPAASYLTFRIDWQWNKRVNKCVPVNCEAPEPDCDNWDEGGQCCQSHPAPSPKPAPPGKEYSGGYGYGYKRDLREVGDGGDVEQSEREGRAKARLNAGRLALYRDEVDDTFCPAPLKAWYVPPSSSPFSR